MISVRTVYPDYTEIRTQYATSSTWDNVRAMAYVVRDSDPFQDCAEVTARLVSTHLRLNGHKAQS